MNNHIILILQKFDKPETNFIKDKECLICLEPIDIEAFKIVMLPCKCSNSVYHIDCIVKLIHSGNNKNFCPHCKTIYEIPLQQIQGIQVSRHQIVPYIFINTPQQEINNSQIKHYTHILIFHIFSNSMMNFINICLSRLCFDYNRHEILKILMILYCFKIFFNYFILIYSKNNLDKIAHFLVYSYLFQTVLFGLLIYSSTKIKNDYNFIILIFNNVFFNFGDLTFRVITEYKMKNTVNIIG